MEKDEAFTYLERNVSGESIKKSTAEFNKAVASFLLGDYDDARNILSDLTLIDDNPRWLLNYAYLLYREGLHEESIKTYRKLINSSPYYVEAYLNAAKVCLDIGNHKEAKKYCDAATRIAPNRSDVKKANALLCFEKGDMLGFFREAANIPESSVFETPKDSDISRLKRNASTVVGNGSISIIIGVFSNIGIRTILVGYKDKENVFSRPELDYRWHPLSKNTDPISIELVDTGEGEEVGLVGFRANGLEHSGDEETPLGFLIVKFRFKSLNSYSNENYVGLLMVDYDKILRLEPRQIFVKDLLSVPEGDLIDLYQDMLFPQEQFTSADNSSYPKVFLSYAREDIEKADYLFLELRKRGLDIWKDDKSLRIGETFDEKIECAISDADFAIVCLSSKSVKKIGFVQKEFKMIIEASKYRPYGIPFALPIKLDECNIPREFSTYHWKEFSDNKREFIDVLANEIIDHYKAIKSK